MNKEDLILQSLKVLLMDDPQSLKETRKCLRWSIDKLLHPETIDNSCCDMGEECVKEEKGK